MSRNSLGWGIIILASTFVIGSALTDRPQARGGPTIPPGGRPGKIRTFYASGNGDVILIPSVTGPNGFVITQIWTNAPGTVPIAVKVNGTLVARPQVNLSKIDLNPGIPAPALSQVTLEAVGQPASFHFTVIGSEF